MKNSFLLFILLILTVNLSAKIFISPIEAMKENYGNNATIIKKSIHLSNDMFKTIQKSAKTKLYKQDYAIYIAKQKQKILGYGILINKKVRSKNGVVIYFIANQLLQGIEIIAFNEPTEYIPNKKWQEEFQDKSTDKMLELKQEIPTITGATLSARSVTEGSRIAFAIYNELLKGK